MDNRKCLHSPRAEVRNTSTCQEADANVTVTLPIVSEQFRMYSGRESSDEYTKDHREEGI